MTAPASIAASCGVDALIHAMEAYVSNFASPFSDAMAEKAMELYNSLSEDYMIDFDDAGSIGKRYRRQDEIGTPLCITYDFESETDGAVTIRDRDTMEQIRLPIAEVSSYIKGKLAF